MQVGWFSCEAPSPGSRGDAVGGVKCIAHWNHSRLSAPHKPSRTHSRSPTGVESDGVVEALEQYGKVRMSRAADLQVSSRLRRCPLLSRRRRGVAGTRRGSCDATRPAPFGPSAAHLGIRRSRRSARGQEGEQCRVQPLTGCALNIPTRALAAVCRSSYSEYVPSYREYVPLVRTSPGS